jgi:hypothetical protein
MTGGGYETYDSTRAGHVVNGEPGIQVPTSKKGWVRIGYQKALWIPCLPAFPEGYDRDRWASEFAQGWWDNSGLQYGPQDAERLTSLLCEIHKGTYGHIPCHLAFIHLPDPRLMPLPIFLAIWESRGERNAQLRMLANTDDPGAVERPIVEEFATDELGAGLRSMRYLQMEEGELYGSLSYAFRVERHETDLRLWTSTEDLGRLHRAIPDIDDFARAITVVSRDELHD